MKDFAREDLEGSRPSISVEETVDFCLKRLYADRAHCIDEEVVRGLSFEELIGALLLARDQAKERCQCGRE